MTDTRLAGGERDAAPVDHPVPSPVREVLRDIARGGIAGIVVGIVVAGFGGRAVMRIATILHEDTVGRTTENGEVIGAMTINGTLALVLFGGLALGLLAAAIWVIVAPWVPGVGLTRAALTAGLAIVLGTPLLIQRGNPDFAVLGFDPLVVALLVGLVGLVGFSIALVDGALDRRLPSVGARPGMSSAAYLTIAALGLVLVLPLTVSILLDQPEYRAPIRVGWALAVTGAATLTSWLLRIRGRMEPPRLLRLVGTGSLVVAVALGISTMLPHLQRAAGMT